jgi:hypothetical protein
VAVPRLVLALLQSASVEYHHALMSTHVIVLIAMKGIFDFIDNLQISHEPLKWRYHILPWCVIILGWIGTWMSDGTWLEKPVCILVFSVRSKQQAIESP